LILGQNGPSPDYSGRGDSTSWTIAVSIAFPVAFCIVLMVILGALALIMISYLRARFRQGGMVNFITGGLLRSNADRKDNVATL